MYTFTLKFPCKALLLAVYAALVDPGYAQLTPASPFGSLSLTNVSSPLPPGWSQLNCFTDCAFAPLLFGPAFSDSVHMSIELCVEFCDAQGSRLAGLKGSECTCSNIFNPHTNGCFESDGDVCAETQEIVVGCPGNRQESCGADGLGEFNQISQPLANVFFKEDFTEFSCLAPEWAGGAPLSAIGSWRFSYFYNDSEPIHALSQNAAELTNPPAFDNLTTVACVTSCDNAGFTLSGLKSGNQCCRCQIIQPPGNTQVLFCEVCGNSIANGASPVIDCSQLKTRPFDSAPKSQIPCTGDNFEFCGGTDFISIYTLPGTGLMPMIPFGFGLDGFCSSGDCPGPE